jgi:cobalt-precorrin-5B (C1)-methyltransferase
MHAVIDPVTGFEVPDAWIDLCIDPDVEEKIRIGRWVLLSDGRLLKRGLTTGTTASAACKGAVISLMHPRDAVDVTTPVGIRVSLPVKACEGCALPSGWRRSPVRCNPRD